MRLEYRAEVWRLDVNGDSVTVMDDKEQRCITIARKSFELLIKAYQRGTELERSSG